MSQEQKQKAADILGFPVENVNYLWGNKCHIGGYKYDDFNTLCGAGDKSGFWPFANDGCFDSPDGCVKCKQVLKKD